MDLCPEAACELAVVEATVGRVSSPPLRNALPSTLNFIEAVSPPPFALQAHPLYRHHARGRTVNNPGWDQGPVKKFSSPVAGIRLLPHSFH